VEDRGGRHRHVWPMKDEELEMIVLPIGIGTIPRMYAIAHSV